MNLRPIGVLLILFLSAQNLLGAAGTIVGRVLDNDAKTYLPGANVYLEGTAYGSSTDRTGEFTIMAVPPGKYTLKVNYVGYEDFSSEVEIPAEGGVVGQEIAMKVAYIESDEIVVYGIRQGQAKALNQQRAADNIMNVVAKEQMVRFPDLNTAEVLQRVPAVVIARDQGEGRYVLIRGTSASLNAVSVDGSRIASPEDEERFVAMDVISANQVASIEVTKSLTPDMDADAIGGSVNLVSKSAFDFEKSDLSLVAGTGYGNLRGNPLWQGSFSYARRFGADNKVGLTLNGNYYNSDRGSDNNEMEWGSEDNTADEEIPWALRDMQLRFYEVQRIRYGFSGNFEFRPDEQNRYFIGGMFNRRDDTEYRHRMRYRPDSGDYESSTIISGASIERELKDRLEVQKIYGASAGGQNQFGDWIMDYTLAYSYAEEERPDEMYSTFEIADDVDFSMDLSDSDIPRFTVTNQAAGYEMAAGNYEFDEIEYTESMTSNTDITGALNFKLPLSLAGNPAQLKFGGKIRMRTKDRTSETYTYGWEGADDLLMAQFEGEYIDDLLGGDYVFGPKTDNEKMRSFFDANRDQAGKLEGERALVESIGEDYDAEENIYAGYAMITSSFGRLTALAGLRYEMTQYDLQGNDLELDEDGNYVGHTEVTRTSDDTQLLPALHLKYSINDMTNLRAAYSKTLSRPNYFDLVPYRTLITEDEEILLGNPDLETMTSDNFDLFAEHYFSGLGTVGGGFFYKSLSSIIYPQVTEQSGGSFDGYNFIQPVNGKSAWLYGFELNWQQQLTMLSGFWNGFGVYANFTWTNSEAELADGRKSKLPGQSQTVGNFAVSYEKYGFTGRIGVNYHGKYIEEVGEDAANDVFYDQHFQWDFAASQQIFPGVRFYAEVVNITDAPLRYYVGETSRPIQREFYSWWVHTGFKLQF